MSKNNNEEDFQDFFIPESFLKELYDLTGNFDSNRGFLLACVGQDGRPFVYSKSANEIVELGIQKALENYLIEINEGNSLDFLGK